MTDRPSLTLTFLGGAESIGASCAVLEVGPATIVIDCGVRFNSPSPLPDLAMLQDKSVDAVFVTHAHSDHTGGLPVLAEAFPAAPVYATEPTIDLMRVLFRDALKLMNSPEREGDVPLYTEAQVERLLAAAVPLPQGQSVAVGDVEVTALPASHILGAAMLHVATPAGNVLLTGDFSISAQRTVPALTRPALRADLVVCEATYGQRLHEDRSAAEKRLADQVNAVVAGGGKVLIPAFAVGRAQEILLILRQAMTRGRMARVPVHVDGMVRAVCDIYAAHQRYVTRTLAHDIRRLDNPFYNDDIQPVRTPEQRRQILDGDPCVIVASSGMLSGGASTAYAQHLVDRPDSAILITGYQDEESPGRALLDLAAGTDDAKRQLKLAGRTVDVRCKVDKYALSAHADRMQIISLLEALHPHTVVLVHGGAAARSALARGVGCRDVLMPDNGAAVTRSWSPRGPGVSVAVKRSLDDLDVDRIRAVLGPPTDAPVKASAVAEAWFGDRPKPAAIDAFVHRLEALGLVRRDDRRRNVVHVLAPGESTLLADEAELEERLKHENFKGRCLEMCMRMRIDPPQATVEIDGAYHVATLRLELAEQTLTTPPCRAASRKAAEQLACAELIRMLEPSHGGDEVVALADADVDRLRTANPKGKLLELCVARRLGLPDVEHRVVSTGYQVRATLGGRQTRWYLAAARKTAEHAACEELLGLVQDVVAEVSAAEPAPPPTGDEPRTQLNQMRQLGLLTDFGYVLLDSSGPSHQPVFTMTAWATAASGDRVETAPVRAPGKKAAQRRAAELLLEALLTDGDDPEGAGETRST